MSLDHKTISDLPATSEKTAVAGAVPKGAMAPISGDMRLGRQKTVSGLSSELIGTAILESFRKLDPRTLMRNPVVFVVQDLAALTTVLVIRDAVTGVNILFSAQIAF